MRTELLPTRDPTSRARAVERAAELLRSGALVALPTETVYGIAARADDDAAVGKLRNLKEREPTKPFTLACGDASRALSLARRVPGAARRLARRYWPGPLTLVLDGTRESVGLRVPGDAVACDVLKQADLAVALPSANPAGQEPAKDAGQVMEYFDGRIAAVVDSGPCPIGVPSTVVDVRSGVPRILRAGFLSEGDIRRAAAVSILFVCTGNTCRSPMAEALLKNALARRLQVTLADLEDAGFRVGSAGLMASPGQPASTGARSAMESRSLDLESHRSRTLTPDLLSDSDRVYVMTRSHLDAVQAMAPEGVEIRLLRPDGRDVRDPFGGSVESYEATAREIEEAIEALADELVREVTGPEPARRPGP